MRTGAFGFAVPRHCDAQQAPILFSSAFDPAVLTVEASPATARNADFDLAGWGERALAVPMPGGPELVLLSQSHVRLGLEILSGTVRDGPVRLRLVLDNLQARRAAFDSLERLITAGRRGALEAAACASPDRARRWAAALCAWDARLDGASHRDVAFLLFGETRVLADWTGASDSLRSQVRRLLVHADTMISGGWRQVLRGHHHGSD